MRAVIVDQNHILVARLKGAHSFLPGGGVEVGEGAKAALRRELQEELGVSTCQVGRFLGVIEQCYEEIPGEISVHVISHLFEVQVASLDLNTTPVSVEPHLEFYWAELKRESLVSHRVLPEPLQEILPSLIYEGKTQWISTYED